MDCKQIEQLLEKYWQCTTSLEEEKQLRNFFTNEEVPSHLVRYKSLFIYQAEQQEEALSEDFDNRVIALIDSPVVKAKRLTIAKRLSPLLKAAAAVIIIIMTGNIIQYSFNRDEMNGYNYDNYIDTYDNPEVAYEQVSSALMMISESINKSKKLEAADTLNMDKPIEVIE